MPLFLLGLLLGGGFYVATRPSAPPRRASSTEPNETPSPTPTAPTPTSGGRGPADPTLTEAWYQDTLRRLRAKLDSLRAFRADDQYWRAVLWLNGAHLQNFVVPSADTHRYDALKYVSDIVFRL